MIIKESSVESSLGPLYRLKRGTKAADVHLSSPVPPLASFEGPFGLAEYLGAKIAANPHDVTGLVELPDQADRDMWIYEHLRRIIMDLTPLVTALLQVCNRTDCPQMRAEEWMYLCVAHEGATVECCAIDYILHSLDSTTSLLSSSAFPSRLHMPSSSTSHFPSLFRRLSRIFSHAYYHHREAFELAEAENALYARFVALCEKYELVGVHMLAIPRSAVGLTGTGEQGQEEERLVELDDERAVKDRAEDAKTGQTSRGLGRSGTVLFEPASPSSSTGGASSVGREGTVRRPLKVLRRGVDKPKEKTLWTSGEPEVKEEQVGDTEDDVDPGSRGSSQAIPDTKEASGGTGEALARVISQESAIYLGEEAQPSIDGDAEQPTEPVKATMSPNDALAETPPPIQSADGISDGAVTAGGAGETVNGTAATGSTSAPETMDGTTAPLSSEQPESTTAGADGKHEGKEE